MVLVIDDLIMAALVSTIAQMGVAFVRQNILNNRPSAYNQPHTIEGISWSVTYKFASYTINLKGVGNNPLFDIIDSQNIFDIMGSKGSVAAAAVALVDTRLSPLVDALERGEITDVQLDSILAGASSAAGVASSSAPSLPSSPVVVPPPIVTSDQVIVETCTKEAQSAYDIAIKNGLTSAQAVSAKQLAYTSCYNYRKSSSAGITTSKTGGTVPV